MYEHVHGKAAFFLCAEQTHFPNAMCCSLCRTPIDRFITEKQKKEKNPFQRNSKSILNDFCITIRWLLRSLHGPI